MLTQLSQWRKDWKKCQAPTYTDWLYALDPPTDTTPPFDLTPQIYLMKWAEAAHWHYIDEYHSHDSVTYPYVKFREFVRHLHLIHQFRTPPTQLHHLFSRYKADIPKAGCLITNTKNQLLLIMNNGSKSWSIPKGKIEPGETVLQCAIRETWEETGVDVTHLINPNNVINYRSKNLTLYRIKHLDPVTPLKPQTRGEIIGIKWQSLNRLTKAENCSSLVVALYNSRKC